MKKTSNTPLVSIITPTFNSAEFIGDNINSILGQSYPRIEHIIVDGGSADMTLSIIRQLNPKARVISEPDRGISDAFNKGIDMASGEIIATLNSDDYYANDNVTQKVVDIFASYPDISAVYGRVNCIDPASGEVVMVLGKPVTSRKIDIITNIAHPALFVKKEVYETVGNYSLKYKCCMDNDFFLRISKSHRLYFLNEILTIMRWGGFSFKNIFLVHRETFMILRGDGENSITAMLNLIYQYVLTFLSLILQKTGLVRLVLYYRKIKGRL